MARGLAEEQGGRISYAPGLIETMRRRELLRLDAQLSRELVLPSDPADAGREVSGTYRRSVETLGGRMALIERSRDITLLPWRPVLERHLGRKVSGLVVGGTISWTFGRGRGGPETS